MYTDIFIVRRDCVFRNFRIFSFLEKAIFSLFSSRKDAHFFVFVTQKRYGNVAFSDYGNVRKSPKISSFRIFSHIFTMRKDMVLCSDKPIVGVDRIYDLHRYLMTKYSIKCLKYVKN